MNDLAVADISMVCSKHEITLTRNKVENVFSIYFRCHNPNKNIIPLINYNLFPLMGELNADIIEKVEIKHPISIDEREILFLFKRFASELGISRKYLYIKTVATVTDNHIAFTSASIPCKNPENYEAITSNFANLHITILNENTIDVNYSFKMDIHEDLPIYMENMMGLLMKKVFYRFKNFIENIK